MTTLQCRLLSALCVQLVINISLIIGIFVVHSSSSNKCKASTAASQQQERIVGGLEVTTNKYPFMACIVIKKHEDMARDFFKCGAAIINRYWVITAARCFEDNVPRGKIVIRSNSLMWKRGIEHKIIKNIVHEDYNEMFLNENDIALAKVETPFDHKYEKSIFVSSSRYHYKVNKTLTAIGWGKTKNSADNMPRDSLREVDLLLFDQDYCITKYGERHEVLATMFCAGSYEGGKDACILDSGGPIFDKNLLLGIISWGQDCGRKESPGVYTRVGKFQKWIIKNGKKADPDFAIVFNDKARRKSSILWKRF